MQSNTPDQHTLSVAYNAEALRKQSRCQLRFSEDDQTDDSFYLCISCRVFAEVTLAGSFPT
jgi:hypothetical protein